MNCASIAAVLEQMLAEAAEFTGDFAEAMAGLKPYGCWVDEVTWPWHHGIAELARAQWTQPLMPEVRDDHD